MINFKANEDILPLSEFRSNLAGYITQTRETGRPIIVTQNGKPTSVLVSIVDWEPVSVGWEDENRIVGQVLEDLRIGEVQFARGKCRSNDEVREMMREEFGL